MDELTIDNNRQPENPGKPGKKRTKDKRKRRKRWRIALTVIGVIILIGFLLPQNVRMPVEGATKNSYHPQSFWYYPWGTSVTHKGVDIFAPKGTPIYAATPGLVLYAGSMPGKGGKVVGILGPKWRIHYYAHLDSETTTTGAIVGHNTQIGTVGNTGNAANTPSHLHYGLATPIPYFWRYDSEARQGWKKMFYLNPIDALEGR